jgi:hypothetical protein
VGDQGTAHEELRTLVGPYVLGALQGDDRCGELEGHLVECGPCREELWKLADVAIRLAADGEASRAEVWERIRDRIADDGEVE